MNKGTILIVEDHQDLAANIGDFLEAGGFAVDFAPDGLSAVHLAIENLYDCIVLDVMMPGIDGFEVVKRLRNEAQVMTPIVMLTARDGIEDKLNGFSLGADDYLVKPFEMKELEARLIALIRRERRDLKGGELSVSDLNLDLNTMHVKRGSDHLKLSPIALSILKVLMRESPNLVTREKIESEIWGDDIPDSDALRSHLYNLRKIVDKPYEEQLIHTIPGIGFKLCLREEIY